MTQYLNLFLESAGHASIIPFISDTTYYAMASFGGYNMKLAFALAVAGAVIGHAFNWGLGYGLYILKNKGYFIVSENCYTRRRPTFERWGIYLLLLSPLPLFNFFTVLAGFFQTRLHKTLLLVAIGQAVRYGLVLIG
jgi:membrane protein YqaA with SNARE-associated domain